MNMHASMHSPESWTRQVQDNNALYLGVILGSLAAFVLLLFLIGWYFVTVAANIARAKSHDPEPPMELKKPDR